MVCDLLNKTTQPCLLPLKTYILISSVVIRIAIKKINLSKASYSLPRTPNPMLSKKKSKKDKVNYPSAQTASSTTLFRAPRTLCSPLVMGGICPLRSLNATELAMSWWSVLASTLIGVQVEIKWKGGHTLCDRGSGTSYRPGPWPVPLGGCGGASHWQRQWELHRLEEPRGLIQSLKTISISR